MDVDREIRLSISAQNARIATNARLAVDRLYWMHAVGSGVCGCGSDMDDHALWDNHGPTEMPIDKSVVVPAEQCPHDDFYRWPNGSQECLDCGAIGRPAPTEPEEG